MVNQTREELETHLVDALEFMMNANERYDEGRLNYAKQLATQVRILVHQTRSSHALLEQLGHLRTWGWVDEASRVSANNLAATMGPVSLRTKFLGEGQAPEVSYVPYLGGMPIDLFERSIFGLSQPFWRWWEDPIVKDLRGSTFSRQDIILAVANKDGGAHVDPTLPEKLDGLKNQASLGHSVSLAPTGEVTVGFNAILQPDLASVPSLDQEVGIDMIRESPIPALVRQISYEVLETVRRRGPQYWARIPNS